MEEHEVQTSPQFYARIGGVLYLIIILIGSVGELFLRDSLIVSGDATATAQRIMSSEFLWRVGTAAEYFLLICAVPLLLILYRLLKPVNRDLVLLAVFFNLVSITIEAVTSLSLMQTLSPLANTNYLKVLDAQQLHALAYLAIKSHEDGFGVSLIFFGCFCIVVGYLILKSGYLPKIVGILMQIAGVCYLTNSFALILSPSLAGRLFPAILLPALVGEASLCIWLLVKGVNVSKWNARVSAKHALSTSSGA